jgi:hypothetical protein
MWLFYVGNIQLDNAIAELPADITLHPLPEPTCFGLE